MEAPEGRKRIVPLPPPEPDGWNRSARRVSGPGLPVVIALIGVIVFAGWLALSGSPTIGSTPGSETDGTTGTLAPLPEDSAPQSTTTTPVTTTVPRAALGELLPWIEGNLLVVTQDGDATTLAVWEPDQRRPQRFRLSAPAVTTIEPNPGSGDLIAFEAPGRSNALYVGDTRRQEPVFVGSHGFGWDPAGSTTLMWAGTDQVTGETGLYRLVVGGSVELVSPLAPDTELLDWTEAGLVLVQYRGPFTIVTQGGQDGAVTSGRPALTELRAVDGTLLATALAEPLRASRSGTIVARGTETLIRAVDEGATAEDALVVPEGIVVLTAPAQSGEPFELAHVPAGELLADGESMFSLDSRWSMSPDGMWVARTVSLDIRTALVVQRLDIRSMRLMPLTGDDPLHSIGFSSEGDWFFAWNPSEGRLIIIDPDQGARWEVPIEGSVRYGGVFIQSGD